MRFPPAGSHPLHVSFVERDGVERWTRHFGDRSFSSHLSEQAGQLVERFGALRFVFDLPSDEHGLTMHISPLERVRPAIAAGAGAAHVSARMGGRQPLPLRRADLAALDRADRALRRVAAAGRSRGHTEIRLKTELLVRKLSQISASLAGSAA